MSLIANYVIFPTALGQLTVLSECACPGRELRLECTIMGGANTIWRGTVLDHVCRSGRYYNEIVLRHSQFESGRAIGVCNNGTISGHNLNRTFDGLNFIYTSQLTILLPLPNATNNILEGKTVECIFDNGLHETSIGTYIQLLTQERVHACIHFRIIIFT